MRAWTTGNRYRKEEDGSRRCHYLGNVAQGANQESDRGAASRHNNHGNQRMMCFQTCNSYNYAVGHCVAVQSEKDIQDDWFWIGNVLWIWNGLCANKVACPLLWRKIWREKTAIKVSNVLLYTGTKEKPKANGWKKLFFHKRTILGHHQRNLYPLAVLGSNRTWWFPAS